MRIDLQDLTDEELDSLLQAMRRTDERRRVERRANLLEGLADMCRAAAKEIAERP